MSKYLLAIFSILIFVGSVSIPIDGASACGTESCHVTNFSENLVNP